MVLGYHLILSAYGFWLPNDPRGSGSDFVRSRVLYEYGPATLVHTRQSCAQRPHDAALRQAAKSALTHPPVRFTGRQALAVAHGLAYRCARSEIVIHACAIMPDHLHLVIARHHHPIETLANQIKGVTSRQLRLEGLHPFQQGAATKAKLPSPWAGGMWKVYLNQTAQMRAAIAYVQANPEHAGLRRQRWSFVTPWEENQ